jgi:preprotein translocase subunit YajC
MHLNSLNVFLADVAAAPATGAAPQNSVLGLIVPMGLVFAIMYFMMIRPQSQRAKQQKKLLAALKSGDKVATAAGIIGIVITVKDTTVSIRSADAKMEVTKDSVTQILEAANAGAVTTA